MADFTAQFQNPRRLELLNTLSDLIGDDMGLLMDK